MLPFLLFFCVCFLCLFLLVGYFEFVFVVALFSCFAILGLFLVGCGFMCYFTSLCFWGFVSVCGAKHF